MAVEMFGPGIVAPAVAAAGGYILLSDDMNYRGFANTIWPVRRSWLQAALTMATAKGLIPFKDYAAKLVGLSRLRHDFISFDPAVLIEILLEGDDAALADFTAAAEFIGTKGADLQSHVAVTVGFINGLLEENDIPYVFRLKAISILLAKLIRNQPENYGLILVGVIIGCNKDGQSLVAGWVQGHCMLPEDREFRHRTLPNSLRSILRQNFSLIGNLWRWQAPRRVKLPDCFTVAGPW